MSEKIKVGALLSRHLKEIASEPSQDGKITKAESLARIIWDLALGVGPAHISVAGVVVPAQPDKLMIALIFDRMEGKIGSYDENIKRIENIPDKVSRAAVQHMNKLAIEQAA